MLTKIRKKIISFLKQGITAQKLALTVAVGLFFGTIPMIGATSALCALAALKLKLNMAVIQAVNYILYPVQLLLFIPFIKLGTAVFSHGGFHYTLQQILILLSSDTWGTISKLFVANMMGVAIWLVIMPMVCWLTYLCCKPVFMRIEKKLVHAGK